MSKTIRWSLNALAREHAFGWEQADATDCAKYAEAHGAEAPYDLDEKRPDADLIAREIAEAYESSQG